MTKRPADTKTSPKAKAKKAEKADDANSRFEPIFHLVGMANVTESTKAMLSGMVPHCFRTCPADRHDFQQKMTAGLVEVVNNVEADHVRVVEEARVTFEDVQKQSAEAAKAVEVAAEEAASARAVRTQKEEMLQEAEKETKLAQAAVAAAKAKMESMETDRSAIVAEKAEYESLLEGDWAVLKAGSMDGKKWRERSKLITFVLKMLEPVGLDAALNGALPVALKTKPADRGKFAEKAIAYSEELLHRAIASYSEKLEGFETEASSRAQALTDAEAGLEAAAQLQEQRQADFLSADAIVREKDATLASAKKAEKTLAPRSSKTKASLADAEDSLLQVRNLMTEFQNLVKGEEG
eukprot:CAMPEP_0181451122 /NCGR_PEP_ID=MMETSP1110-20121109/28526_1 /TAXON_ID=174948 /ORGANISM="Symbiodinium sp., Strain CCMP421" /LENGTH=351 /DNA_ID=CAMNT_0023575359 /DNA_START=39 /DNA_END=1094 /DNA_ORIENTATION=+